MFESMLDWFKRQFAEYLWFWENIWRQLAMFFWSGWGLVIAVIGLIAAIMDVAEIIIAKGLYSIQAISLPVFNLDLSAAMFYLEVINTILPVSETLVFILLWGNIVLLMLLYRGVKSLKEFLSPGG